MTISVAEFLGSRWPASTEHILRYWDVILETTIRVHAVDRAGTSPGRAMVYTCIIHDMEPLVTRFEAHLLT
jgi:hypothetical protein